MNVKGTYIRFRQQTSVEVTILVDDLFALREGELHDTTEDGALHIEEGCLDVLQ